MCRTAWLRCVLAGLRVVLPDRAIPALDSVSVPHLRALLAGIPHRHLQHGWLASSSSSSSSQVAPTAASSVLAHSANIPDVGEGHVCSRCGRVFATYTQMRSHQFRLDCNWEDKETGVFFPAVDSRTDMPSCHWCGAKFLRWHGVKIHIEKGQCSAQHLRKTFMTAPTHSLDFNLDQDLRHHCVMCSRWFKFPTSLSCHLKAAHRQVYDEGRERYSNLDLTPAMHRSDCIACGHISKSCNHMNHINGSCVVILQRCMARVSDPLASNPISGEQISWVFQSEQQQQQQPVAADNGQPSSSGCRSFCSSRRSASRLLGGDLLEGPAKKARSAQSSSQSTAEEQGQREGEREREGQGNSERNSSSKGRAATVGIKEEKTRW